MSFSSSDTLVLSFKILLIYHFIFISTTWYQIKDLGLEGKSRIFNGTGAVIQIISTCQPYSMQNSIKTNEANKRVLNDTVNRLSM